MLTKITKAFDFALTVLLLVVASTFCQPSEAKSYQSMLALDKASEEAVAKAEAKRHQVAFTFETKKEVVEVTLFASSILFVSGVVDLYSDDLKKFRVVFDHRFTDVNELADVINRLIENPLIYEKTRDQSIEYILIYDE